MKRVKDGSYKIQRPFVVRHQQERDPFEQAQAFWTLPPVRRCRPHPHQGAGERVITGWFAGESSLGEPPAHPTRVLPRLPFSAGRRGFYKGFSYEQKILSEPGAAAPHPRRMAGSGDELHLLPAVCWPVGCVVPISVYMVISGVPAIHKIGLFQFLFGTKWASTAAQPLFPAVHPFQHLRHALGALPLSVCPSAC